MKQIQKVCVAGGGVMGTAISQFFAQAGFQVSVYEIDSRRRAQLPDDVRRNQRMLIERGMITAEAAEHAARSIVVSDSMDIFSDADLVIEAVVEILEVKQRFFEALEKVAPADAILSTNTSGLSINAIGALLKNRARYVGANWWTPAYIIPLVEIVKSDDTSDETAQTLYQLLEAAGKKPILVKREVSGFVGNRMQFAMFREAMRIVEEGWAEPADVDRVLQYGLGLRYAVLGPFAVADYGGVDTYFHICDSLFAELDTRKDANDLIRSLYEQGKFGLKTGEGFYSYEGKDPAKLTAKRDETLLEILKLTMKEDKK